MSLRSRFATGPVRSGTLKPPLRESVRAFRFVWPRWFAESSSQDSCFPQPSLAVGGCTHGIPFLRQLLLLPAQRANLWSPEPMPEGLNSGDSPLIWPSNEMAAQTGVPSDRNDILLNDDRCQVANSKRTDFQLRLGRWIRDGGFRLHHSLSL